VLSLSAIAFEIGPIVIHWYAIIIIFGLISASFLARHEMKKVALNTGDLIDFILITTPLSIIGARIYYVIFNLQNYLSEPLEIFAIWNGGLAIYGGLIVGVISTIVFCKKRALPLFKMLDVLAPSVMLAQAIGRWGNFVNQEAYGGETTAHFLRSVLHLPNFIVEGMEIGGIYYQPTFLYESLWNLMGCLIILALRHKVKFYLEGEIFWQYVTWYSFGRFFIEGMRSDSLLIFQVIRVSQALSALLFFGALIFIVCRRKSKNIDWYFR